MAKRKKTRGKVGRVFGVIGGVVGKVLSVFLTLMLIGAITGTICVVAFGGYVKEYLWDDDYDIDDLRFELDMTTMIYYPEYADVGRKTLLGYVEMEDQRLHGSENRFWAPIQEMPKNLTNAFIAIEDKRFYEHSGIDLKRTLGATLEFAKGNKSYGGSTITQQLIKNITDERDSTIQRKVTEISRAISLTKKKTKSEVLEMYLNTIPLSHGNYGVAAAAKYFFNKELPELTLVECASLAAIPKSPTKYDPERNPEYNKERRGTVLHEMYDQGLISEQEYNEAKDAELVLNINQEQKAGVIYSYFTDELRRQVQEDLMEEYGYSKEFASTMILSGGLKIYATVDPYIQGIMEEVYEDEKSFNKVDDGLQPESAMIVMAPDTGDVLGVVGGRGEKTANMTLNRATRSTRQIGSSIKPISVYAPALDLGIVNYATVMDDLPVEYNETMGRYWPRNSPAVYDGKTTLSRAIATSKNTTAVKLVQEMTPQYSYNFVTETLGANLVKADIDESPMALGGLTYGMTAMETAAAYTMLANNGVYSEPRFYTRVEDSQGRVILEKGEEHRIAVDKSTAQIMTKLLCGVVNGGTGTGVTLRHKIEVAGKTGTTNKNYDLYFVGYTPYYLGATWFGYDQNRSLAKFGANQALVGWDKVMNRIHQRVFETEDRLRTFNYSGLVTAAYCMDSGLKPGPLCSLDIRGSRVDTGFFKPGTEPVETCDCHVVVKWDRETKSIASERCPAEDVGEIVLIKVGNERIHDKYINIADAQYTVMDLPNGYIYPNAQDTGIFINLLPAGTNYGYVPAKVGDIPINSFCSVHHYAPEEPEITEPDTEKDGEEGGEGKDSSDGEENTPNEGDEPSHDDGHEDLPDIFDIITNTPDGNEDTDAGGDTDSTSTDTAGENIENTNSTNTDTDVESKENTGIDSIDGDSFDDENAAKDVTASDTGSDNNASDTVEAENNANEASTDDEAEDAA